MPDTISWWQEFYAVIREVPRGRVSTYGAIAALAGRPRAARHVGFALAALKEEGASGDVPWHRVLGARPRQRAAVSIKDPVGGGIQRAILEDEGVRFDDKGNVALSAFGWLCEQKRRPSAKKAAAKRPKTATRGAKTAIKRARSAIEHLKPSTRGAKAVKAATRRVKKAIKRPKTGAKRSAASRSPR